MRVTVTPSHEKSPESAQSGVKSSIQDEKSLCHSSRFWLRGFFLLVIHIWTARVRSKDQGLACGSGGELLPPRPTGASGLGSLRLGPPSLTATLTGKDLASQCQARAPSSASPAESGVEERGEGACRLLSVTSPLPEGLWGQGAAPSACSGEASTPSAWVGLGQMLGVSFLSSRFLLSLLAYLFFCCFSSFWVSSWPLSPFLEPT